MNVLFDTDLVKVRRVGGTRLRHMENTPMGFSSKCRANPTLVPQCQRRMSMSRTHVRHLDPVALAWHTQAAERSAATAAARDASTRTAGIPSPTVAAGGSPNRTPFCSASVAEQTPNRCDVVSVLFGAKVLDLRIFGRTVQHMCSRTGSGALD